MSFPRVLLTPKSAVLEEASSESRKGRARLRRTGQRLGRHDACNRTGSFQSSHYGRLLICVSVAPLRSSPVLSERP
jgi:hypothetical protein